ncbi:MAG TPA: ABC transporter substrate-binding protein [Ramlibacter sp.]|nr:ABC transporter substrate-binding protein [Ramlibacter sp.]
MGADACIARINASGGIHGRRIRLLDRDDGYRAEKAAATADELLQQQRVFAMLGAFGTPTLPAIMDRAGAAGAPLVGANSLTNEARQPFKRHVFPVRAASLAEAAHVVRHQRTLAIDHFAVLTSTEAYGPPGAAAYLAALQSAGVRPVAHIAFSAKDDPAAVAQALHAGAPQSLLIAALPKPFAAVLAHYRKLGGAAQGIAFSAMRIEDIASALGPMAAGLGLSQPVPAPTRQGVPLVHDYRSALSAVSSTEAPSYNGLEGYLEARVLAEGLRRTGRTLTRESLVAALESLRHHDFGGVAVHYSPVDRTGSTYMDIVLLGRRGELVY